MLREGGTATMPLNLKHESKLRPWFPEAGPLWLSQPNRCWEKLWGSLWHEGGKDFVCLVPGTPAKWVGELSGMALLCLNLSCLGSGRRQKNPWKRWSGTTVLPKSPECDSQVHQLSFNSLHFSTQTWEWTCEYPSPSGQVEHSPPVAGLLVIQ